MGDANEHQFTPLSARIASLNPQHIVGIATFQPTQSLIEPRSMPINIPRTPSLVSPDTRQSNNEPVEVRGIPPSAVTTYTEVEQIRPPLPARVPTGPPLISSTNGTAKPSPALPPRVPPRLPPKSPEQQIVRRESNESLASMTTNTSLISIVSPGLSSLNRRPSDDPSSLRSLPPLLSEANLPPLPPSKRELMEKKAQARIARRSTVAKPPFFSEDSLPPPLPSRKEIMDMEAEVRLVGRSSAANYKRGLSRSKPLVRIRHPPVSAKSLPSLQSAECDLPPPIPLQLEPGPGVLPTRKTAPVILRESLPTQLNIKKLPPPFSESPSPPSGTDTDEIVSDEEIQPVNQSTVTPSIAEAKPSPGVPPRRKTTPVVLVESLPSQLNTRKLPPPFSELQGTDKIVSDEEIQPVNQSTVPPSIAEAKPCPGVPPRRKTTPVVLVESLPSQLNVRKLPPPISKSSSLSLGTDKLVLNEEVEPTYQSVLPQTQAEPKPGPGFPSRRKTAPIVPPVSLPSDQNVGKLPPPFSKCPALPIGTDELLSNEEIHPINQLAVPTTEAEPTPSPGVPLRRKTAPIVPPEGLLSQMSIRKLPPPVSKCTALPLGTDEFLSNDEIQPINQSAVRPTEAEPMPGPGVRRKTSPILPPESLPSQQNVRKLPPLISKCTALPDELLSDDEIQPINQSAVLPTEAEPMPAPGGRRKTAPSLPPESLPSQQNARKLPPPFPKCLSLPSDTDKHVSSEVQPMSLSAIDPNSIEDAQSTIQSSVAFNLIEKAHFKLQSIVNPNVAQQIATDPPAIPRASRPTNSEIDHIPGAAPPLRTSDRCCLTCRDFSAPDRVAAQWPRESIENLTTEYLAQVLCGPFTSPTDKARAIFTWICQNIAYDTEMFFSGGREQQTPEITLAKGMAICAGYANIFTHVAMKADLECVTITGHGKGIYHKDLEPGESVPPYSVADTTGHAWNAVEIDGGEWKLIDACWGAGSLVGKNFVKQFNAYYFTVSNEDFGLKHFPPDDSEFFRNDGLIPTWEEYYMGPGPVGFQKLQLFGQPSLEHGIDPASFLPAQKIIVVSYCEHESLTRFKFSKLCEHWDFEVHGAGKPFLFGVLIKGLDGRGFRRGRLFSRTKELQFVPLESDGFSWTVDIETKNLGARGQKLYLCFIKTVDKKEARGMSSREFKISEGVYAMEWVYLAEWELA